MTEEVIKCRTPGKVILHGEHAVVYGKTAVAVSVDLDTKISTKVLKTSTTTVKLDINFNFKQCNEWSINELSQIRLIDDKSRNKVMDFNDSFLQIVSKLVDQSLPQNVYNSVNSFLVLYLAISDSYCDSKRLPMEMIVSTSLPIGAGLGSSSSYTVGLTASLMKAYGVVIDLSLVSEWGYQMDKLFHGRPSGIDNSICTFGGALQFKSGKIVEQLAHIETSLPVILVNTGVPRNTKAQVEKLRRKYDKYTNIVEPILEAIDAISISAWDLIKQNNHLQDFANLFELNQHLLNCCDVGHPAIDKIVDCANKLGLSAKMTGAGGGGTVIIFNTLKGVITKKKLLILVFNT
ncbi:mevalonate kinase-like [Oppia nitens]|uniref:mevalonate kinase-like n=1 Tax=Oppia nitens TaxID=1686743 RepID=UPI0023DCB9D5|nr:mevalonate kinase-like [Oppia nitens]